MLSAAITRYHSLLTDPAIARASQQRLTEGLRSERLFFGDRPLVTVLRPRLLTAGQYAHLQQAGHLVAQAARRVAALALEPGSTSDAVRAVLQFTPAERALLALSPGYAEPSAHSRMDTFLTVDGASLQFIEYNAESPAAIAYADVAGAIFLDLPVMQVFAQHYRIHALPARQRMADTLLATWHAAGSPGGTPRIAIVDWAGVPTATEFELFRAYFAQQGLPALICTPADLVWRGGKLYARPPAGGPEQLITIVYKRVLTSELLQHYGDDLFAHPLLQAYAAGACVLVNSFRSRLLHKKSLFALLTDERFAALFTPEEQVAIQRHVPWTRPVQPGETTYQGERIELLRFAQANRERLLLKPDDGYGGRQITIGWEAAPDRWEAALAAALTTPFVVQERVPIAYEPYPTLIDGRVVLADRLVDSDPFLFGSEVAGCLCRLSTQTLLNVSTGGGSIAPVFVIEPLP